MARKCTVGFYYYVHFPREEGLRARIEIATDEFADTGAIRIFLQKKEEENGGKLLTLEEAVDAIYDYMRGFYSVVAVKGTIKYYGEEYIYEVN